ncbi:MAG TPA: hypothetical protein VN785_07190, partial [Candidatus Angelobacter sp.]|nr:hypothetical protein [Candidatus Angelobacter sp.]
DQWHGRKQNPADAKDEIAHRSLLLVLAGDGVWSSGQYIEFSKQRTAIRYAREFTSRGSPNPGRSTQPLS